MATRQRTEVRDGEEVSEIGRSMPRVEDRRILTGEARYIHDYEHELELALVRSPHPHAEIVEVDASAARTHPECELALTIEDLEERYEPMSLALDGFEEYPLADGKVRYVGEPVAAVVASDRYVAEDLVDEVDVTYKTLEPAGDVVEARDGEILVNDDHETNIAHQEELEFGTVDEAFATADNVVEGEYSWGRIGGVPLETTGVVADYDGKADAFTIASNIQHHTWAAKDLAPVLGVPADRVTMHNPPDVGGSYGSKGPSMYRYCLLAAMASHRLGRSVKFEEDRIEFLTGGDIAQSTGRTYRMRLALDDDGTFRGIDVSFVDDAGAFPTYATNQVVRPLCAFTGPYDVQDARYEFELVLTNRPPQTGYRGFGLPPNEFALEMIVDKAARELDFDPTELRRRNLIQAEQMPYVTAAKAVYDSGDYQKALDRVQELVADNERGEGGLLDPAVMEQRREEGKYRGVAASLHVEPGGSIHHFIDLRRDRMEADGGLSDRTVGSLPDVEREYIRGELRSDGDLVVSLAADSAGQGHQTLVSQLAAETFGIDPDNVIVDYLDSDEGPAEVGQGGSRLAIMLSGAVAGLADELTSRFEQRAADIWGCNPTTVRYEEGTIVHRTRDATLSIADLASMADDVVSAAYAYDHPILQYDVFQEGLVNEMPVHTTAAFNANAPIVEVDVETGEIEMLKIYSVRDCGTQLNPDIVEGQYIGGIVQGIGAALLEEFVYESGQPQSTTLFDYRLPSVRNVPEIVIEHGETPSPFTETGAKGIGETGMIDMPASIAASINAALTPLDIHVDTMPFTLDKVRETIRSTDQ